VESWKFVIGLLAVGLILFWIERFGTRRPDRQS